MEENSYDIIVIGAGAGGLVVAIGAAKAGKNVLLIERGHYGGDCTNFGCIPSKSLIASAHHAHSLKESKKYGIDLSHKTFEASASLERVRKIIEKIRHHEEPEALHVLGVKTLTGAASFKDAHTLIVKGKENARTVRAKQIVIATGSHPAIPPIEGIERVPYLTNETIFDLKEIPTSMVFLGGGPIGCELAQAFARLGSEVSVVQRPEYLLKREEPEAKEIVKEMFEKEGIKLYLGYQLDKVESKNGLVEVLIKKKEGGESRILTCEKFMVSSGRKPNLKALALDQAGIKWSEKGIGIDSYGRTSQKHVWAIGDIIGEPFFTHFAEHAGRTVLSNLLLPFKKKVLNQEIPRATFTDPEVASIGILEEDAVKRFGPSKIQTYKLPFANVDRAICEGREEGFIKVVTKKWSGKILGVCIVGTRAGEMLASFSLAMKKKISLRYLAGVIPPYPTYTQGIRKAADLWLTQMLLPSLASLFKRKKK